MACLNSISIRTMKITIFKRIKNLTVMDVQALKLDLIHWLTELQDSAVLEKLQAFKNQETNRITEEQKEWLDERLASYHKNPSSVLPWDKVAENQ